MTTAFISAFAIEKRVGTTSGLINIAGNQIYFEVAGQSRPIVFLHDGILHSRVFDAQFSAFAQTYTVIRYDRQGYGASKPPSVAFSEVNTLKGLFDYLGLETALLIGGSAGGRLALNFTITYPECVEALVLVGAPVSGLGFTEHMANRGWRNKWGESIPEFINFWANDPWLIAEENPQARARLRQLLEASPLDLNDSPVEMLEDVQALPHLSKIRVPTLILVGESDIADNHAHAGVIQIGIKDSERKVITHAGHLVYLEQPEKFNEAVNEFLNARVSK